MKARNSPCLAVFDSDRISSYHFESALLTIGSYELRDHPQCEETHLWVKTRYCPNNLHFLIKTHASRLYPSPNSSSMIAMNVSIGCAPTIGSPLMKKVGVP